MSQVILFKCDSDTHKKFAALENKGVSYDCKVEPSFIGYASSSFILFLFLFIYF